MSQTSHCPAGGRAAWLLAFVLAANPATLKAAAKADENSSPGPLRAGAASSNITPWLGISMNGGMRDREAVHVHDELHARAVVLDNGKTRLAIVLADSCVITRDVFDRAKDLAQQLTGIPADHMLMAATHTHTGATAAAVFQSEPEPAYLDFLGRRLSDAVARASNNLAPARFGWGCGELGKHLFNRRWYMKPGSIPPDPFGNTTDQVKMNPPRASADLLRPAGPTDPQLPVISLRSTAAGRPIALLAAYSLHYVGGGPGDQISADYFGVFSDRIQALLQADRLDPPFVGMLANGTSGDVNNIDFTGPPPQRKPYEQVGLVAQDVAAEVARAVEKIDYHDQAVLAVRQATVELGVRKPGAGEVENAKAVLSKAKQGDQLRTLEEIYAHETVLLAKYPEKLELILQVMRIGDAAIVAIPCEVFTEIGLEIKKISPFQPTAVIELANGYNGYLPTPAQHKLGGYETWRARSSYLEPEASVKIVSRLKALLQELK